MINNDRVSKTYATADGGMAAHVRRLVLIYDIGLRACADRNLPRLEEVLDVLQERLDYGRWPTLGMLLYAQFNSARSHARAGNFVGAGHILAVLRNAWTGNGRICTCRTGDRRRTVSGLSVKCAATA
jgi:hypothetical protein